MYLNFDTRLEEEREIGPNLKLIRKKVVSPFVGTLWIPGNWLNWSTDARNKYIKHWGTVYGLKGIKGQNIKWKNGEWKIEYDLRNGINISDMWN